MDSIHIHGGVSLQGKVRIQGSKNAALPILAATILTKEVNVIQNCPKIADVYQMLNLLKSIGCSVCWEGDGVRIDASEINLNKMPEEAITGMRSSLCLMGALLGRTGEISMEHPGGCVIGARPIDLHISSLRQMGVTFMEEKDSIRGTTEGGLHGACIHLEKSSVGATQNILLAAVMADGMTVIHGAAKEPEVETLCHYLQQCGAHIEGVGTEELCIIGGRNLYGVNFAVPSDRIVAGTYLFGCLATGGNVLLENAPVNHMKAVIEVCKKMGAECQVTAEGLYVQTPEKLNAPFSLTTAPYPGFPTDLQSIALVALIKSEGYCLIEETIFENRFRVVEPLVDMGADIIVLDDKSVVVRGITRLYGRTVEAKELRGGAALVIGGLVAEGETIIHGCNYIYRGYENICKDLRELGARIYCV